MYKGAYCKCTEPLCIFGFFREFMDMHPRPHHKEAAVLSALTSNRHAFTKRNCPQDYYETPFKLVARQLQFPAERLARVTAYSARRSGITAMLRSGLHPSVVNYASHHLPSQQVSTAWDYNDPSLHLLCAPSQIMACLVRRFRYLATVQVGNRKPTKSCCLRIVAR